MLNSFFDKYIFTNGLKYTHHNFYLLNLPFVILPIDIIVGIMQKEDKELNQKIYYSIKEAMKNSIRKDFQVDFGAQGELGLEFMGAFFTASGWGKIETTDTDMEKCHALVTVTDSPVAANCKNVRAPVDAPLRAVLAGIFSIYFKKDVDCVEVKCSALNDAHCDFVIKPLAEFNFDNPNTRSQLKVE